MLKQLLCCAILHVVLSVFIVSMGEAAAESTGDLLWYKHQGAEKRDLARSVALLPDGSTLLHGWVEDYWAPDQVLSKAPGIGLRALFLAKYNPGGELQWLKIDGTGHCDEGGHISALSDGTCVMGGTYSYGGASAYFGYREAHYTYLTPYGFGSYVYDIAIAKYNPDGTLQWARRAGSSKYDECTDIGMAPDGSCFVTGFVWATAAFGDGDGVTGNDATVELGEGEWDASFLAWYDTNGILGWVSKGQYGECLAVQPDGSCLIANGEGLVRVAADGTESAVDASAAGYIYDLESLNDGGFMAFNRQTGVFRYDASHTLMWNAPVAGHTFAASSDGEAFVFNQTTGTVTGIGEDGGVMWTRVVGQNLVIEAMAAAPTGATFALAGNVAYGSGTSLFTDGGTATLTQRGSGDIFLGVFSGETRYYLNCRSQGYGSACLTPQKNHYSLDEPVLITAEPFFEGYEFSHWEGDLAAETGPVVSMSVTGDLNATAVFVPGPDAQDVPAAGLAALGGLVAAIAALGALRR
jgi:hypothetical protein